MLEEPIKIVKRKEWGARKCVSGLLPVVPPLQFIVVHFYTGRKGCYCHNTCMDYVKKLQRRSIKERHLADIPYSFLIAPSEEIYEGRGWDVTPDKSLSYKNEWGNKYDVTFIGNYLVKNPGVKIVKLLQKLIQIGIKKRYVSKDFKILQIRDAPLKLEKYFDPKEPVTKEQDATDSRAVTDYRHVTYIPDIQTYSNALDFKVEEPETSFTC